MKKADKPAVKTKDTLPVNPSAKIVPDRTPDKLRTDLAIGVLSLLVSVILLYFLNDAIYSFYTPDTHAIAVKAAITSYYPEDWFHPEPVERMQYQLSLLLTPFFVFFTFYFVSKLRSVFERRQILSMAINIAGLFIFFAFCWLLASEPLVHVEGQTTAYFFANNLIGAFGGGAIVVLLLYFLVTWLYVFFHKLKETPLRKIIVNIICWGVVGLVLLDLILYNIFNLPLMGPELTSEADPVFYSITQVYAGKALLVDFNAQYGLYAWVLAPVFRVIGMSSYKIGLVLGSLNAVSFLLIYLGIKKIIREDILSLIIFLCLAFWQYWQTRIPFGNLPRPYYQYWPVRMLFPAIAFYLFSVYIYGLPKTKKIVLPLMAICCALGVLWNLDSGLVAFGAVFAGLGYSTFSSRSMVEIVKRSAVYCLWMFVGLLSIFALFFIRTRLHSGHWPELSRFTEFQRTFYVTGFFMLPMSAFHFWNVIALVYFAACIYCVANLRKQQEDTALIAFLFVLGAGLFSYFQGRSYDTTLNTVMYPAILLIGIFCRKLYCSISENKTWRHEGAVFFVILFLFLADGALSMVYYLPELSKFSIDYASERDANREQFYNQRVDFIRSSIPKGDTVLMLSRSFESFWYATGGYIDPVNLPGFGEQSFKWELDSVLSYIKTTRHPIIFDALRYLPEWYLKDSVVHALARYTTIEKSLPDRTMLLLKPGKKSTDRLTTDSGTVYYNDAGDFTVYLKHPPVISLHNDFSIEFFTFIDSSVSRNKDNFLFTNASEKVPFCGVLFQQNGEDLSQFEFEFGNGKGWAAEVRLKMLLHGENHVLINVQNGRMTIYNNGQLSCDVPVNGTIKNSDGKFLINTDFKASVSEMKVENL